VAATRQVGRRGPIVTRKALDEYLAASFTCFVRAYATS
jgi:hypothetical protein